MTLRARWISVVSVCLVGFSCFALGQSTNPDLSKDEKRELAKKLDEKVAESKALNAKAADVTKKLGELASSGKLPNSDEAIELMRRMVEDMAAIRKQLD